VAAKRLSELQAKLKKADPIIREFVAELKARNAKRQHQIVKLEADKIERDHRINALEKERKKEATEPFEMPDMAPILKKIRENKL
jgi:hypothetical protein